MGKVRRLVSYVVLAGLISGTLQTVRAEESAPRGQTVEERLDALDQRQRVLERNLELDKEAAQEKSKSASVAGAGKDGFVLKSPDGNFQLKIGGFVHADGRFFLDDELKPVTDTFLIRRAFLNFEGTVHAVEEEIRRFLSSVGIVPSYVVPISAREGDSIAKASARMPWYGGPTLLSALDSFSPARELSGLPLRFPVQDVYVWDRKRIYAGRVETGELRPGDRVVFAPSGKATRVRSVEKWGQDALPVASAGECVGITLADELFLERGEVMGRDDDAPRGAREIFASLFWLGNEPLRLNGRYVLKLATSEIDVTLSAVTERLDSSTLEVIERHAEQVENLEVANVTFHASRPVAADTFEENPRLGRFVVSVEGFVAGGGIVREARTDFLGSQARLIRLDARLATEPDGNLVDLSQEAGPVEFTASAGFIDRLSAGERVAIRLRTADQLERIARLAFGHDLAFEFRRDAPGPSVVLFRDRPVKAPASDESSPAI